jgi:hypothetical protein
MTRQLTNTLLTAGLSALLGAAALSAQDRTETANVPFAFHTQQTTLEAGKYRIQEQNSKGIFQLYAESGRSLFVAMHPVGSSDPNNPKLTFACYGGQCVLAKISMPGTDTAWGPSQSSIEKNLSHKLGVAAMISVPLRAR